MKTHKLKSWPDSFQAVWLGQKTAEFRKDDRGFEVGDCVLLQEYDSIEDRYSGREMTIHITHVLSGGHFGIPEGYVILSFIGVTAFRDRDSGAHF